MSPVEESTRVDRAGFMSPVEESTRVVLRPW
jgi:hypothetical protein